MGCVKFWEPMYMIFKFDVQLFFSILTQYFVESLFCFFKYVSTSFSTTCQLNILHNLAELLKLIPIGWMLVFLQVLVMTFRSVLTNLLRSKLFHITYGCMIRVNVLLE